MSTQKKENDLVKKYSEKEIKENFVPIDESDVAHAVDVPVKEKPSEKVEIVDKEKFERVKKKAGRKKKASKKIGRNNWHENFKIPGPKKLKKIGPILIITEKPQAAQKIADALAGGNAVKRSVSGVSYYDLEKDGEQIQVVCAVGHLFSVAQVKARNKWPTFEIAWAPSYMIRKSDFTKKYYDAIAKLCKKASKIIVATDYDIEGEVIGMNIVKFICNQKDAERMKFSTLTANEIQQAYEKKSESLDWGQAIAGETRHYLDWIYGINLSRALMSAIKSAGNFRIMSIGRVQGPTLKIIVEKEHEIQNFKPEKYWQVFLDVNNGKNILEVQYEKNISKQKELGKFEELEGKKGEAVTKKSQKNILPPLPFDLTSLQTEAYRLFKITPSKTLEIAQRLYLAGIISYPRTSSQKIPKEIGYDKILQRLKTRFDFLKFVSRKIPVEGKKKDPAHPSIYPTGEFHNVEGDDKKIYELIVKRFVSCFCEDALLDHKKVQVVVDKLKFGARGMEICKKGWMEVYPSVPDENQIPDINGKVTVKKVKIEEKMTQPPHRYTPASIISTLEKKNLGTKATRASILETLYNRGYIKDKAIKATSLGISLIDSLEKNCPIIIDENLTKNIERDLEEIRESKKPKEKEEKILEENKKVILKAGEHFDKNQTKIGKDLIKATEKLWEQEKKDNEICQCPVCKKGKLVIKYGKQYNRYFIGCSNYPDCKTTFTLPPNGLIKKTDKICKECGFPMLMRLQKGKRPWIFCFNPECPSRNEN